MTDALTGRREDDGWRAGKPVEDPAKVKRWGFITARPSEYLVHVRGGNLRTRSSGQGATCFKFPWDSVAIIPTSLQRLQFSADQVTMERVGVRVHGFAVYRIANPLLAYRVLNFSYPESAQEKLSSTLASMFEGASRRLIANLTVEDCLQKRKEALANELLREIAPIVGSEEKLGDEEPKGWGVVVDSIEIQDVKILSDKVFAALQAPFRAAIERKAREAKAEADLAISLREAETRRESEQAKLSTEAALQLQRVERDRSQQLRSLEVESETKRQRLATEAEVEERKRGVERAAAEARAIENIEAQDRMRRTAEAELAVTEVRAQMEKTKRELERAAWIAEMERRKEAAEVLRIEGEVAAAVRLRAAEAAQLEAQAKAKVLMAENLPQLAAAVGQRFGEVNITQVGGTGPFNSIAEAVASVVALVKET